MGALTHVRGGVLLHLGEGAGVADYRNSHKEKQNKEALRAERRPYCHLCGERIDYDLPREHPKAFSADHVKPWSTHPELREDYGNLKPAHSDCNKARGNRPLPAGLGLLSREW